MSLRKRERIVIKMEENKENVKTPDAVVDKSGKEFKAVKQSEKKQKGQSNFGKSVAVPFLSGVLRRSYTGTVRHSRNCGKSGKSIIPKRRACTITGTWRTVIMKTICRVKKYESKSIFM